MTQQLIETLELPAGYEVQTTTDREKLTLIAEHVSLARALAARFANSGESMDDLVQVAMLGLVSAARRFDPGRDVQFSTFALSTITGELKRHFRDKGWAVRVSRRLKELHLEVRDTAARLTQELGRSPRIEEIAKTVGASVEDVLEAMEVGAAYRLPSLDAVPDGEGGSGIEARFGVEEAAYGQVEQQDLVDYLMDRLTQDERELVAMRFTEGLSQSQIAQRLGTSQMQVSRSLARVLAKMRKWVDE